MFLNAAGLPHRHANNLQDADLYKHAHSAHINLVICMVLMAAFHYVWNILPMLSLASPPLSWHVFPLCSHWVLYLLMRSDFIKEGPLRTFPRSFSANASISSSGERWQAGVTRGGRMTGEGAKRREDVIPVSYEEHDLNESVSVQLVYTDIYSIELWVILQRFSSLLAHE